MMGQGRTLKCRQNFIHSQSLSIIAEGLGVLSDMEHIDLNDNRCGLSPWGEHSSEGIRTFSLNLTQTLHMRVVKLARNALEDEDIILIAQAVKMMPTMTTLDLSGNYCSLNGVASIRDLIISHSILGLDGDLGIRDLDLSCNPFGDDGVALINEAVEKTDTLTSLKIAACRIQNEGMAALQFSLAKNHTITWLDVQSNEVKDIVEMRATAEAQANQRLKDLK